MNLTEEIKQFRYLNNERLADELGEKRVNEVFEIVMREEASKKLSNIGYCESPIEKLLCLCLWDSKYIAQAKIGHKWIAVFPQEIFSLGEDQYRADFYIRDEDEIVKVIIECDGHDFHELTKEQARRDKKRDRQFQTYGYKIMRFTGQEIYQDPFLCAKEVWNSFAKWYTESSSNKAAAEN